MKRAKNARGKKVAAPASKIKSRLKPQPSKSRTKPESTIAKRGSKDRRQSTAARPVIAKADLARAADDLKEKLKASQADLAKSRMEQAALAEVLGIINSSSGNLAPVFDCILENAHHLCGAPCGSLQLYEGDRVVPVAIRGMTPLFAEFLRRGYPITEGIRGSLTADHPRHNLDIVEVIRSQPDEPSLRAAVELGGIRTMVTVPLVKDGTTFGRIVAARQERRPFSDKQVTLLQSFAEQAVIAIQNARLFNETREALERQTATADILKVIASSPSDVQPVFEAIAASANRLLGGFSTAVFRFMYGMIHLRAFTPTQEAADEVLRSSFPRPASGFAAFESARDGKPAQVVDTEDIPDVREIARARGYRSMLFAPLTSNGAPIGTISVTRREAGSFAAHHVRLLQTFAD